MVQNLAGIRCHDSSANSFYTTPLFPLLIFSCWVSLVDYLSLSDYVTVVYVSLSLSIFSSFLCTYSYNITLYYTFFCVSVSHVVALPFFNVFVCHGKFLACIHGFNCWNCVWSGVGCLDERRDYKKEGSALKKLRRDKRTKNPWPTLWGKFNETWPGKWKQGRDKNGNDGTHAKEGIERNKWIERKWRDRGEGGDRL